LPSPLCNLIEDFNAEEATILKEELPLFSLPSKELIQSPAALDVLMLSQDVITLLSILLLLPMSSSIVQAPRQSEQVIKSNQKLMAEEWIKTCFFQTDKQCRSFKTLC
jgi:hypothetical protein